MIDRNILEITNFSKKELQEMITRALFFSKTKKRHFSILNGKRIGLLFDSNSLRTKLSFEIATHTLGGVPYYIDTKSVTHEVDGTPREVFEDIMETLDKFVDGYVIRDYSRKLVDVAIRKTFPPFLNGFSVVGHPSQSLADLSAIISKGKDIETCNICVVCPSSGSGVIESFIYGVLILGGSVTIITPNGRFKGKNKDFYDVVKQLNGRLKITDNGPDTMKKADVLYVDEWWDNSPDFIKKKPPKRFQVDKDFLKTSKPDLIILHCLPAHHNREISKEVFYSKRSIVFDEARFRIYSAMALLEYMFR